MPKTTLDAIQAARRYMEDPQFAATFDGELAALYEKQAERLRGLAQRLRSRGESPRNELAPEPAAGNAGAVNPDRVRQVLVSAKANKGLTRGQIASWLGADTRDVQLTKALHTLKESGAIVQKGSRRSARYFLGASRG